MRVENGELILTREDVNSFCKNCGGCCRNLTLEDSCILIRHFGREYEPGKFWGNECLFSTGAGCAKYEVRPRACKEWRCGVVEVLKEKLNAG